MTTISICMIVKNEAENLKPLLADIIELVNEVIIVDTGSADDTVKVANELGVVVIEYLEKPFHFANARNVSLAAAKSDFVFVLDGDDRIKPAMIEQARFLIEEHPETDVFFFYVKSQTRQPGMIETIQHPRLFRTNKFKYENRYHEALNIDGASVMWAQDTQLYLDHFGYTELPDERAKRAMEIIGESPQSQLETTTLATAYFIEGFYANVIGLLAPIVAMRDTQQLERETILYQAYIVLMMAYREFDSKEIMFGVLAQLLREYPYRQHAWALAALYYLDEGNNLQLANACIKKALVMQREDIGLSFDKKEIVNLSEKIQVTFLENVTWRDILNSTIKKIIG